MCFAVWISELHFIGTIFSPVKTVPPCPVQMRAHHHMAVYIDSNNQAVSSQSGPQWSPILQIWSATFLQQGLVLEIWLENKMQLTINVDA